MNGFRKMAARLRDEGWYVGWNEPCCQSCAWDSLPMYLDEDMEIEVDYSKVLFNHSQDCEVQGTEEECSECDGEGYNIDTDEDCSYCGGTGYEDFDVNAPLIEDYDTSVHGFICNYPEQQNSSVFCFDGTPEGVENLKAILPIIEECGCSVNWSGSGEQRIDISWEL